MSTAARISVVSILASLLTSMSMTILDAIIVGYMNWYMLIFLGQVSAIALLTLQLLKKRNFVVESEFSIVPFAVSVLVVTTLLMVYSYFFADQVRWSNHYGVLTAPLLVLMVATVARR
jgi:hypothetical protein